MAGRADSINQQNLKASGQQATKRPDVTRQRSNMNLKINRKLLQETKDESVESGRPQNLSIDLIFCG